MREPICMILEPTELSVAKAEKFGTLTYLFHNRREHPGTSTSRFGVKVIDRARELGFNPSTDYFVITGQLMPMVMATTAMVAYYGQLRGLYFNGHNSVRDYECIIIGERAYNVTVPVTTPVTNEEEEESL